MIFLWYDKEFMKKEREGFHLDETGVHYFQKNKTPINLALGLINFISSHTHQ
jgi:hypothetical protein